MGGREVPLILMGLGNVGRTLLAQVLATRGIVLQRTGLRLVPIALADISGVLSDPYGLPDGRLESVLATLRAGQLLAAASPVHPLTTLPSVFRRGAILADLTAAPDTAPLLRQALEAGCGVVLANKLPLAGSWQEARLFYEHPRLRYEVTVGAGLPIIHILDYLLDTGDDVVRIEGCLSGTLGYLCAQLEIGVRYSEAVRQARALGYTEPDPREDLSGNDVARKALILGRTAGWPLELSDLNVERLYSQELATVPLAEFLEALPTLDQAYLERVAAAKESGNTLRYVAEVNSSGGTIGLKAVPQSSPLGALRGPGNYIAVYTKRYCELPLVVAGPGAGPEVTAAGVLGDILALAQKNHVWTMTRALRRGGGEMGTLTMKFGGTSVGNAEAIRQACDIILEQALRWERLTVVVSAMNGVTDALIKGARTAAEGDDQTYRLLASELRDRHHQVIAELFNTESARAALHQMVDGYLDEFVTFCRSVYILGEVTPRAMDTISSFGERINARILAALLVQKGLASEAVDATELIITDKTFQNAVPLMDKTRQRVVSRLVPMLEQGKVPVVTGFIGATENGITTTLGRGGSDYSAAIIGVCLDSDEVWIWTDVDGVMTADPRWVPDARVIPSLSYAEVSELAYYGAKVLHPRTIRPVIERNIPLWVKNTFNPSCPGTRIVAEAENSPGIVKAVTAIRGLSLVTVEGRGMMGVPGIAARTFSAVASQGTSVLMIVQASSEQSICFVIPSAEAPQVVQAIEKEMALELARRDIERVWTLDDIVIVCAVGRGMRSTPGVAARVFSALGQANINVIGIAQGSSDCSISLVVAADDAVSAVQQIHREVILNGH